MHYANLRLGRGERSAVVGASGSGKSPLAHAGLGILPYNAMTSGEMLYRGEMLDAALQEPLCGREMALNPQAVTYLAPLICVDKEICRLYGWQRPSVVCIWRSGAVSLSVPTLGRHGAARALFDRCYHGCFAHHCRQNHGKSCPNHAGADLVGNPARDREEQHHAHCHHAQ